ncbi:hypothetical protein D8674_037284 [Pyrus ussuriensis x Pyrus communis]|uniref:Uncharacterized protein n=1 Tax=Pyrus ussuriensis x Pyrus communis TaxID=2448454 RepID=A0A5N5FHC5_9ROSA|nr:hypothetical protein D8674_037284 [Pyrus ussuriensis x Pyrus communis]
MGDTAGPEFPGFQTCPHKDDNNVFRRHLSRLQRRAPCPLQLNPTKNASSGCSGMQNSTASSSTSSSSSSLSSFCQSKDPIPLLSPLVLLP